MDPVSTIDDITDRKYNLKENVQPTGKAEKDQKLQSSSIFLSDKKEAINNNDKFVDLKSNTSQESPQKRRKPLGLHIRNA